MTATLVIDWFALLQTRPALGDDVNQIILTAQRLGRFCWVEDERIGQFTWPEGCEDAARERYEVWRSHGVPASLMKLVA